MDFFTNGVAKWPGRSTGSCQLYRILHPPTNDPRLDALVSGVLVQCTGFKVAKDKAPELTAKST